MSENSERSEETVEETLSEDALEELLEELAKEPSELTASKKREELLSSRTENGEDSEESKRTEN
jgi:hypothetical protein